MMTISSTLAKPGMFGDLQRDFQSLTRGRQGGGEPGRCPNGGKFLNELTSSYDHYKYFYNLVLGWMPYCCENGSRSPYCCANNSPNASCWPPA